MRTRLTTVRTLRLVAAVFGLALLTTACEDAATGALAGLEPSEHYIHVQATEQDARRGLDQDPFPQETIDLFPEYDFSGDDGYVLRERDDDEWQIGSYVFLPQEITLIQGDTVTMDIFGVRGSEHDLVLEIPGQEQEFTVFRGELHQIEFTVDEPGRFQLVCETHPPTMVTNITVLPSE